MTTPVPAPFVTSREFDAPRDLVWEVHAKPEHLREWIGADGFRSMYTAMDFRPGGFHHYGLAGPNGGEMWGRQVYRDIEPQARIVHLQSFSDADGGIAPHPIAPEWPLEMLATTTFEDAGPGRTRVTVSWQPHDSDDAGHRMFESARGGMEQGFAGMWRKLERYLAGMTRA